MTTDKNMKELGTVKIANDVVVAYVCDAVLSTQGVVDFSGGLSDTISQTILGKESKYKGLKIDESEGAYNIDVYVIVGYGVRIPETAWNIQKNVKSKLEAVMEIEISNINIHVQGVRKNDDAPVNGDDIDD